ncbi:maltose alpha-D-glucosyltransferase [Acidithiobacillus ferrivorans]|uniref:maltose alpha-D-glucosyltransferase n=1 Tax=Acidithiobacillus ferrivorans TaxID=160808 RepID=A0A7T4WCT8_9PROT|nr:maltose alpha-D-glucosyltransferase [Acidithiobacillus ferrivorans]QQD72261.1 maltose alpha-D-glucosyltransferase [Acidithiobacillus ferrivorans]
MTAEKTEAGTAPDTAAVASAGGDTLWYKDAILYELHVRTFQDSNGDGIGDFPGLTSRLDYLQDLGVNTLWLLPFYPSPLRDDGYDISDYRGIHPDYGTLDDFRHFLHEAHRRGLKVITELVINHSSDQHPWFQAARRAPPGSAKRNYYVWSDTDKKFPETRIIFSDSERSNWAWDDVAKAYYWHRFFSHQPDLNHNNPQVVKAMIRVLRYWLDMGVDGLRLDAIPYLCVRADTDNENLPETHAVIRQFRSAVDVHYRDRVLLAEANQWPEDVREYFGQGDECQMAYHFPLMPRVYMSLALEDRHPITDILRQTPDIPENCQWAIFLRNHDELTLEMVTRQERDYLYREYAADPRMRLNLGIRRRLAPLLGNDRQKIKLLTWLLMSMPGSPIVYYGDEIGMGDNIYLGDRNGVRTPMQWSPDYNGGFSRADPEQLYLPLLMDPVYGYQAVNVESQSRNASSLLHWTRKVIAVRKEHPVFGRGNIRFLRPGNRKMLAYLREYAGVSVLCVANLARTAQAVELGLEAYAGRTPVELMGKSAFPPIGQLPYLLTLPAYAFLAFALAEDTTPPAWHEERLARPELPALVLLEGWRTFLSLDGEASDIRRVLAARTRRQLQEEVLTPYLRGKHWAADDRETVPTVVVEIEDEWRPPGGQQGWLWMIIQIPGTDGENRHYSLPLAIAWEDEQENLMDTFHTWILARVRQRERLGVLLDAFGDDAFCRTLVRSMDTGGEHPFADGVLAFEKSAAWDFSESDLNILQRPSLEQRHNNILFGERLYLKGYRHLQAGGDPEFEVGVFLTEVSPYTHMAPVLGRVEFRPAQGDALALALLRRYIENQGDAWTFSVEYLERTLTERMTAAVPGADASPQRENDHGLYRLRMATLGRRVAELHRALEQPGGDQAFDPEPFTAEDLAQWVDHTAQAAEKAAAALEEALPGLPEGLRQNAQDWLAAQARISERLATWRHLPLPATLTRIRCPGHLGLAQALLVDEDFILINLGGDPRSSPVQRRHKQSPLLDLAAMRLSLMAAALAALRRLSARAGDDLPQLREWARTWAKQSLDAFAHAYDEIATGAAFYPADPSLRENLLELALWERLLGDIPELLEPLQEDILGGSLRILLAGMETASEQTPDAAIWAGLT